MPKASPYTYVTGMYEGTTANAFWIVFKPDSSSPVKVAIGRSLIHGADERAVCGCPVHTEVKFRLMVWKARELGL